MNHVFGWIPSGDFFWAVGLAVMLFGSVWYIDSTVDRSKFSSIRLYWLAKSFTRLVNYTACSNLCDELFFDPLVVSWQEWVTALLVFFIAYGVHYVRHVRESIKA
jgi:tellurite resistance protein TehA-like permease